MRSARVAELEIEEKIEATWDIEDPIFSPRERAALEMATIFTEDYKSISDDQVDRWRKHFTDEEIIELGTFMALADGFGKLVEMLGLGGSDQSCEVEI
ncbi:MAG: carboxymuconolactone decarboxylase family protein [Acidimicrobiia bacterium]